MSRHLPSATLPPDQRIRDLQAFATVWRVRLQREGQIDDNLQHRRAVRGSSLLQTWRAKLTPVRPGISGLLRPL
jgi:hypothetical protein